MRIISFALIMMIFSGCIFDKGPAYRVQNHSIKEARVNVIQNIVIRATNNQQYSGALVGAILGYMFVGTTGLTNDLSKLAVTLVGGLIGSYVSQEHFKSDAQELQVEFDSGESALIVVKGEKYRVGDKIRVESEGNTIVSLQLISGAQPIDYNFGAVY